MPKKKGQKKTTTGNIDRSVDFTLNDCANASKPVHRLKKSTTPEGVTEDLSWDQIEDNDLDIIEETNEDGTKSFVYKKRQNHSKSEDDIDQRPGIVYPEIVWYLISQYISPEAIGCFAGINKATYVITKKESFWRSIYNKYCRNNPRLPHRLRIENSYNAYGLRQRVIRALYYTHDVFLRKVIHESMHDSKPHQLVKRCCTNVWYNKGLQYWSVFFKFKKLRPWEKMSAVNFLEDLGSIDANPEEDAKVLTVSYAGKNEKSQVFCGETPNDIYACLGNPKVVRPEVSVKCDKSISECDKMKCIFKESGWMDGDKVDKKKVSDSFDQFAKDNADWAAVVQHLKTACLSQDLSAQGIHLNCPAYDVMHCALTSFIRHASVSQWTTSSRCTTLQGFASACPICPSDCFAPAIPYGTCNACLSLPRSP